MLFHQAVAAKNEAPTEDVDRAVINVGGERAGLPNTCQVGTDRGHECVKVGHCDEPDKSDNAVRYWPNFFSNEHVAWNQRFAAFEWSIVVE